MRNLLTFLILFTLATALRGQNPQPAPSNPKPKTCWYYGQDMKYCGQKAWQSENRCKKHYIESAQKQAVDLFYRKYKGKIIIINF